MIPFNEKQRKFRDIYIRKIDHCVANNVLDLNQYVWTCHSQFRLSVFILKADISEINKAKTTRIHYHRREQRMKQRRLSLVP